MDIETKKDAELSFESAYGRLEQIVKALEDPVTTLDDTLLLYSEGIELIRLCNKKLDDAEQKITILGEKNNG